VVRIFCFRWVSWNERAPTAVGALLGGQFLDAGAGVEAGPGLLQLAVARRPAQDVAQEPEADDRLWVAVQDGTGGMFELVDDHLAVHPPEYPADGQGHPQPRSSIFALSTV